MRREEHYPPLTNAQLNSSPSLALKSLRSFMSAAHCKFAFLIFRSITPCCENVGTNCQMSIIFIAQIMQRDRGKYRSVLFAASSAKGTSIFPREAGKKGNCAEARARALLLGVPRGETRKRRHNTEPISSLFLHANASDAKHERRESQTRDAKRCRRVRPSVPSFRFLFACVPLCRSFAEMKQRQRTTKVLWMTGNLYSSFCQCVTGNRD